MARSTHTSGRAKRIVEEGSDIQTKMHALVAGALADGRLDLAVARDAAEGVAKALAGSVPRDPHGTLRQVIDGMASAVAAGAGAAGETLRHAAAAGRRLSSADAAKLRERLGGLEKEFFNALHDAADGLSGAASREWKTAVKRAKEAGTDIRPAAAKALAAARADAPGLAVETMKAGARAARTLGSELAMGLSGVLSGVGSVLRPASKVVSKKKKAPSVATKKTGAKRAKKTARRSAS